MSSRPEEGNWATPALLCRVLHLLTIDCNVSHNVYVRSAVQCECFLQMFVDKEMIMYSEWFLSSLSRTTPGHMKILHLCREKPVYAALLSRMIVKLMHVCMWMQATEQHSHDEELWRTSAITDHSLSHRATDIDRIYNTRCQHSVLPSANYCILYSIQYTVWTCESGSVCGSESSVLPVWLFACLVEL